MRGWSLYYSVSGGFYAPPYCGTPHTHAQYETLPRRPHMLEETTYTRRPLLGEVVERAKRLEPSPALIHIDVKEPVRAGAAAGPPRVEGRPPYARPQNSSLPPRGYVYSSGGEIEIGGLHRLPHH